MAKKILLAGHTGYIGRQLSAFLQKEYEVHGASRSAREDGQNFTCDFTQEDDVKRLAQKVVPDHIILANGSKDIKYCQQHPNEAFLANGNSLRYLFSAFPTTPVIYLSSDYVFAGLSGGYKETDQPDPATVYGESKLLGEQIGLASSDRFCVVRISALYSSQAAFLQYILGCFKEGEAADCFSDAFYSPVYCGDFCAFTATLLEKGVAGRVFHCAGERVSRYEFAQTVAKVFGYPKELVLASLRGTAPFIFPDLSLDDDWSRTVLGVKKSSLSESLNAIKEELAGL